MDSSTPLLTGTSSSTASESPMIDVAAPERLSRLVVLSELRTTSITRMRAGANSTLPSPFNDFPEPQRSEPAAFLIHKATLILRTAEGEETRAGSSTPMLEEAIRLGASDFPMFDVAAPERLSCLAVLSKQHTTSIVFRGRGAISTPLSLSNSLPKLQREGPTDFFLNKATRAPVSVGSVRKAERGDKFALSWAPPLYATG